MPVALDNSVKIELLLEGRRSELFQKITGGDKAFERGAESSLNSSFLTVKNIRAS